MGLQGDFGRVAILRPRAVEWRLVVKDGREWDCGNCLPKDFRELPKTLRRQVPLDEIRSFLPEPYRRLSDDLFAALLVGSAPSMPSVVLAGGIKFAWLFIASDSLVVPADWNRYDNVQHAVGHGGNGASAAESTIITNGFYSGSGGGGAAYAGNANMDYAVAGILAASISTDVTFDSASVLKAAGGGNAGSVSGGSSSGGVGGLAASCVGAIKSSGWTADTLSGISTGYATGGFGGPAGGPHGDAIGSQADAGYGGSNGYQPQPGENSTVGQDGIDGPSGGFNPGGNQNAGAGGGGGCGYGDVAAYRHGKAGGSYGGGGGGSGAGSSGTPRIGSAGGGAQGCVLVVNNSSA